MFDVLAPKRSLVGAIPQSKSGPAAEVEAWSGRPLPAADTVDSDLLAYAGRMRASETTCASRPAARVKLQARARNRGRAAAWAAVRFAARAPRMVRFSHAVGEWERVTRFRLPERPSGRPAGAWLRFAGRPAGKMAGRPEPAPVKFPEKCHFAPARHRNNA